MALCPADAPATAIRVRRPGTVSGLTAGPPPWNRDLIRVPGFGNFCRYRNNQTVVKPLTPVQQRFILHWGEMGTRWGLNRTVAQIHALLYISPRPVHAEDIAGVLNVARSNVSTSLKELQGWGIVRLVHVLGDKRDHFESMKDVWELFRIVIDERKKREIDPTLAILRDCIKEAEEDDATDEYTEAKLRELQGFFETTMGWYLTLRAWPTTVLVKFMRLGDKARKLLGLAGG